VYYLSFDGTAWSKPLRIESSENKTSMVTRVRLAVDNQAVAHLLWWTATVAPQDKHGYAVVSGGRVQTEAVVFARSPIDQGKFNLGLLPDGKLFLAYKARIPDTHPDANKLHIRYRDSGKWTAPTLIDGQAGALQGHVYTAWSTRGTFVSWLAREEYAVGGGVASTSVRRYSTTDESTWSPSRWTAKYDSGTLGGTARSEIPVGPIWCGICIDSRDRVHMAWGSCSYSVVADLSTSKASPTDDSKY